MSKPANPTPTLDPREKRAEDPLTAQAMDPRLHGHPDRRPGAVCPGHQSPWECFEAIHLGGPRSPWCSGSRGAGKSFLSALDTHLTSRWDPGHGTRILGGSKVAVGADLPGPPRAWSTTAEGEGGRLRGDRQAAEGRGRPIATAPRWRSSPPRARASAGRTSRASSSTRSTRSTPDLREAAMGMCMDRHRRAGASVGDHDLDLAPGQRADGRADRAGRAGEFPLYTFCTFEVLERCPKERSGPNLEKCPECPIDGTTATTSPTAGPQGQAVATATTRSTSLIQKVRVDRAAGRSRPITSASGRRADGPGSRGSGPRRT